MDTVKVYFRWALAEIGNFKPLTFEPEARIVIDVPTGEGYLDAADENSNPILTIDGARFCYNQLEAIARPAIVDNPKADNDDDEWVG